jgi:drug/metabolite transporter (DMT)-like permease
LARKKGILGGSGVSSSSHNLAVILAGLIGGVMGDALWNTQRLPLYDQKTHIPQFVLADVAQLAIYFILLFFGLLNNRKDLSSFSYGLIVGKSMTTVVLPSFGLPRYIFYDVNESGQLVPVRDIAEKGLGQIQSDVNEVLKVQNNVV